MSGVNKAILIGNLGRDPEVRFTGSGTPVCNFSIATSKSWTNKNGEKEERTEWHNIVAWDKLAEACGKYLAKGSKVYVEGEITSRDWEDKDGNKRFTTEIVAYTVQFLSTKQDNNHNQGRDEYDQSPPDDQNDPVGRPMDDDIPF